MRSLTVKLVLGFTLVSLVGIALVAIMVARFTGNQVRQIFENQNREELIADLAEYYQLNGSWRGLDRIARSPAFFQRYAWGFVILDIHGNVVLKNPAEVQLPANLGVELQRERGIPILVDGSQVGSYLNLNLRFEPRVPLSSQISRLYNTLILASIGAVLVSVFIGVLIARSLTRTLRELTAATQEVARGDLDQQVPVRSKDELGELADSFNRMSADLTKSRELRRQMTADIAHELRTPLTVVLGHTEALSDGQLPPEPETFDIIYDETKRLNRLVEDLRTLSLSDAGELQLNIQLLPPGEMLERSAAARKQEARANEIKLEIEADDDLPPVNVDPDRMIQVLINLLDNALRYTPPGGEIRLTARRVKGDVEIAVMDTGPGIPEESLEHLFERFYRGDKSRQRETGGSGLGLAIVKSLVEIQGGQIDVESEPGQGSIFTIKLPVV